MASLTYTTATLYVEPTQYIILFTSTFLFPQIHGDLKGVGRQSLLFVGAPVYTSLETILIPTFRQTSWCLMMGLPCLPILAIQCFVACHYNSAPRPPRQAFLRAGRYGP